MFETVHDDWRFLLELPLTIDHIREAYEATKDLRPNDHALAISFLNMPKSLTLGSLAEVLREACTRMKEWEESFVEQESYDTFYEAVRTSVGIAARCAVQEGWRSIPEHLRTLSEEMMETLELDDDEQGLDACIERLAEEVLNEFGLLP